MTGGQERMVLLGTIALAMVLVGAQAWSLWTRLGENAMPMAASASVASFAATEDAPDLQAVMAFAPFGRTEGGVAPQAPVTTDTPVDLTLLGITLSETPAASRAIIAAAGGTTQSYGLGETLPSGAVLASVGADHVVLRAGDGETTLHFPTDPAPPPQTKAAPATGPDLTNLIPATTPTSQALLTGIKLAMTHDPQGYVAGLGLTPDTGGYRVTPDMDQALGQAGLHVGDLVTSVNGQTPGDPQRDLAILDTVAAAGTAILQVDRDGQTLTLTVPLE
jgi:general secretion pathway protein C